MWASTYSKYLKTTVNQSTAWANQSYLRDNLTEESKNETEYDKDGQLIKLDFVPENYEERESSINEEEGRIDYAIRKELVLCVDPFILHFWLLLVWVSL